SLPTGNWSVIPTASDTLRPRTDAFLALDNVSRRLVLYGGVALFSDHYVLVDDVWTLPLDGPPTWSQITVANAPPSPRQASQHAWDPLRQRVLVQGGKAYGALGLLSDTWALTLDSPAHWDPIATTGVQVTRYGGGGIVDVVNDRFVIGPGNFLTYPPPAD